MNVIEKEDIIDEYFYSFLGKTNAEILRDIICEKLLFDFWGNVIKIMTDGIEDWQITYIWRKDKEYYLNNPFDNLKYMVVHPEKYASCFDVEDITCLNDDDIKGKDLLKETDLAGRIKLVQYRLLDTRDGITRDAWLGRRNDDSRKNFGKLLDMSKDIRNSFTGHSANDDPVSDDVAESQLEQMSQILAATSENMGISIGTKNNKLKDEILNFKDQWQCIEEAFVFLRTDTTIVEKEPVRSLKLKDLYHYYIMVTSSAFQSKNDGYIDSNLMPFLHTAKKKLITTENTIKALQLKQNSLQEKLNSIDDNEASELKSRLKAQIKNLDSHVNDVLVIPSEFLGSGLDSEDEILYFLRDRNDCSDEKWCLITDNDWVANEAWEINPSKIIAVRLTGHKEISIFNSQQSVNEPSEKLYVPQYKININKNEKTNDTIQKRNQQYIESNGLQEQDKQHNKNSGDIKDIHPYENNINLEQNINKTESRKGSFADEKDHKSDLLKNQEIPFNFTPPVQNESVKCADSRGNNWNVTLKDLISEGGEGKIYSVKEDPGEYIKIYKSDRLNSERTAKLRKMIEKRDKGELSDLKGICWPKDIVYDRRENIPIGFTMDVASYDPISGKANLFGNINDIVHELENSNEIDGIEWERINLFQICINIAELFQRLHQASGIFMGDINPGNILVDKNFNVYFIDTDSFQIDDYCCPVGMAEFTSPFVYQRKAEEDKFSGKRTLKDEEFSSAVLYFYILFLGELPFDIDEQHSAEDCILGGIYQYRQGRDKQQQTRPQRRNYIWKNLSKEIQDNFERVFVGQKTLSDQEWSEAFREMRFQLSKRNIFSNELHPSDVINTPETEKWERIQCRDCGKMFWKVIHEGDENDRTCPACKDVKDLARKKIYHVRCSSCGKIWTINKWDANGADSNELKCPDCGYFSYYRSNEYIDSNQEINKEKIEEIGFWSIYTYKKGLKK